MPAAVLLAFALTVLPLSITPGVSSALVTSRVLAGGRREGWKVACGTVTGLYVHATTAAVGLAAVVMASSRAFTLLKVAGALYLVGLGSSILLRRPTPQARSLPWHGLSSYTQAVLGNVLNPKAAGVYLTLLPQFVDPSRPVAPQVFVLATVHAAVALAWLGLLSQIVTAASSLLRGDAWRGWMGRTTGVVMVVLGLRTAVATRA
ncbi:MAG TPA: LysE family translocator [Mycobacteriales bacterium]|nr:LysE family translocator [Mycobacteriales bacterium]